MNGGGAPAEPPVRRVLFGDLRPGETPIDSFDGLKVPGITTYAELTVHEGANIADALVDYFREGSRKPVSFDLEGVKAVHRDMFGNVWEWAGQFRLIDINIPFAAKFPHIQAGMANLLDDLSFWEAGGEDVIEQAAMLHHRAVQIHPFVNGNGRWARMLTNVWLMGRWGILVEWPAEMVKVSPVRAEYIASLKAADLGDYEPLIGLHRRHQRAE